MSDQLTALISVLVVSIGVVFFVCDITIGSKGSKLFRRLKRKHKIALMHSEYGFGSDTYDFVQVFVLVDKNKKIIRRSYIGFIRRIFGLYDYMVDYGYGYDKTDKLYDDFSNKKITI